MRIRLGGKYWNLVSAKDRESPNTDGFVDSKKKTIAIRPGLEGEKLLETVIHECCHGAFPFVEEETVERFGYDLSRVLARLGAEIDSPPRPEH